VEPIHVPEDLSGLSDEELTSLLTEIGERVESLAEEARTSDEALAQVEDLVFSKYSSIKNEINRREAEASERSERLEAALDVLKSSNDNDSNSEEEFVAEEDNETVEAEDESKTTVEIELSVTNPQEEGFKQEEVVSQASEDSVDEFSTSDDSTEVSDDLGESSEEFTSKEVQEVPAFNEKTSSVSRLRERMPEAVAPRSDGGKSVSLAARFAFGTTLEGQPVDIPGLAKYISEKRISMGNAPTGTFEKITLASATFDYGDDVVGGGAQENYSVFSRVAERNYKTRQEITALVASGGVCAPLEPNYDFFRLAEELNPVEQCLDVVGAPRGGIRYIQPPVWQDAEAGVRVTTEAEDAAGYVSQGGPTPDKPCVVVTCPQILECRVDAVSRCVRFGNLNYRVFPEQVEAFLSDLAVAFTRTKEVFYLDAIDAASIPVTAGPSPYGASRSLAYNLSVTAANYRRRYHMGPRTTLTVLLPSWVIDFLKVDMVNDHALGLSHWCMSDEDVMCWFARNNLDVCWYYDGATGAGQDFNDIQAPGAVNQWPDTVVSYMFAPGTFVRLDGGTLDVGMVRDSALNGTNDLELFAEQWIQVCKVGFESLRVEHTLCPTGAATEPVPPLVCTAGIS
jgi:hypothetical protein